MKATAIELSNAPQDLPTSVPNRTSSRFSGLLDFTVTPTVWGFTLIAPGIAAWYATQRFEFSSVTAVGLYLAFMILTTIVVVNLIRVMAPIRPGVYSFEHDRLAVYRWTLWAYIFNCNLVSLRLTEVLLPIPLRKLFYWAVGARVGGGLISIAGLLSEPFLVTLEEGCMIGHNALLLSHAISRTAKGDLLLLGRITIGKRAIVGAGSTLMPGVHVSEGAVVNAGSMVPANTRIGPHEVWGGNPAKKVGELG